MKKKRILILLGIAVFLATGIALGAVLVPSWAGAQAAADTPPGTQGAAPAVPSADRAIIAEGRLLPAQHPPALQQVPQQPVRTSLHLWATSP